MKKSAVVIFARLPQRGRVKTRLAPALGAEAALALHIASLQSTARLVAGLPPDVTKWIYFTGSRREAARAARTLRLPKSLRINVQPRGDLGKRMQRSLRDLLRQGFRQVVFLGSDSPTLSRRLLRRAFKALERHPIVIGPARDGGYYLLAAREVVPEIFTGIDWGTEQTLQQTLRRLRRARRKVTLLPLWYDVDRPADLPRLRAALRRDRAAHLQPLRAWFRLYGRGTGRKGKTL